MDPELQALLDALGLTEQDLEALFESGVFGERMGLLGDQAGMANQMRQTPAPEMRQVGRVAMAANPLETLGAGISRVMGEKRMADIQGQASSLIDLLKKGNRAGGMMAMRDRYGAAPQQIPPVAAPIDLEAEEAELIRRLTGR